MSWIEAPERYCPTYKKFKRSHGWLRLDDECFGWSVRAGSVSIRQSLEDADVLDGPPNECTLYLRHPMQRLMSAHCLFKIPKDGPTWKRFVDRVLRDTNPYWMPQMHLHSGVNTLNVVRLEGSTHIAGRELHVLNGSDVKHRRTSHREYELGKYYEEDIAQWNAALPTTEENVMTRDTEGNIVPQCEAEYIAGINHMHCTKERGHDGEHKDARGTWNEATERAEDDQVPAGEGGG